MGEGLRWLIRLHQQEAVTVPTLYLELILHGRTYSAINNASTQPTDSITHPLRTSLYQSQLSSNFFRFEENVQVEPYHDAEEPKAVLVDGQGLELDLRIQFVKQII
ncbi:hypothetical protein Cni_G27993 [Canna indica]|uniref:Uncharacterized protein n=1 Tax=Canna indica TaxID=4628 RepID=A0AAQ3L6P2_9LILI|nr:hypothetical protein Cni_G27993 [Canna indica]